MSIYTPYPNPLEAKRQKKIISNIARALSYELIHEYNNITQYEDSEDTILEGIESVLQKHFIFGPSQTLNCQSQSQQKAKPKKINNSKKQVPIEPEKKVFFGKYTPNKHVINNCDMSETFDTANSEEKQKYMFNIDWSLADNINDKVHYEIFDEKKKSQI